MWKAFCVGIGNTTVALINHLAAKLSGRKLPFQQGWAAAEQGQPRSLEELHAAHCLGTLCAPTHAPFYLNGWRAFSDLPSLAEDCPQPAFLRDVNHTEVILQAVLSAMLGKPAGAHMALPSGGSAPPPTSKRHKKPASFYFISCIRGHSRAFLQRASTVAPLHCCQALNLHQTLQGLIP